MQPPQMGPTQDAPYQEEDEREQVSIDAVVNLLRNERMRNFRLDVETDQMIQPDEDADKQRAVELVTSVGQFLGTFGPMVQQMPPLSKMAGELLLFALRRFRVGRDMEETIEQAMTQISQVLANPAPPQPDPSQQAKTEREQLAGKVELAKGQQEMQQSQQAHAANLEQTQMEQQAKLAEMAAQHQREQDAAAAQHAREMEKHMAAMAKLEAEGAREIARHIREMERADHAHSLKQHQAHEAHEMTKAERKAKRPNDKSEA